MREGYTLLKSIETLHTELKPISRDNDNQMLTELLEHYHEQLKSCDESYADVIATLRQIQMNINRFDNSCQEIERTIGQQRTLFEQFVDSKQNILPDNLSQQIQVLKTLQREIETKTNSMLQTLKQTTKETPVSETKIERLTDGNESLKSAILVSLEHGELRLFKHIPLVCRKRLINVKLFSLNTLNFLPRYPKRKPVRHHWLANPILSSRTKNTRYFSCSISFLISLLHSLSL